MRLTAGWNRHLLIVLALGVAGATSGCAPMGASLKVNEAQTRVIDAPSEAIYAAVQRTAHDEGWTVVDDSPDQDWLEAETAPETAYGMTTRERWVFRIIDKKVTAQLFLEEKKGSSWMSVDVVCDGYNYFREKHYLSMIERLAGSSGDSVVARTE